MWELFHEQVPFDNDLNACVDFICNQEVRPRISMSGEDEEESEEENPACTKPIAEVIRKCWVKDAEERPSFNWIIEKLTKEISYYRTSNDMLNDNEEIEDSNVRFSVNPWSID